MKNNSRLNLMYGFAKGVKAYLKWEADNTDEPFTVEDFIKAANEGHPVFKTTYSPTETIHLLQIELNELWRENVDDYFTVFQVADKDLLEFDDWNDFCNSVTELLNTFKEQVDTFDVRQDPKNGLISECLAKSAECLDLARKLLDQVKIYN